MTLQRQVVSIQRRDDRPRPNEPARASSARTNTQFWHRTCISFFTRVLEQRSGLFGHASTAGANYAALVASSALVDQLGITYREQRRLNNAPSRLTMVYELPRKEHM